MSQGLGSLDSSIVFKTASHNLYVNDLKNGIPQGPVVECTSTPLVLLFLTTDC